jgi:hypothetical protein
MERLTVIEFVEVVEEIFQANDYNPEFVHQVLANDENSTDEELLQYFEENGEDPVTIQELLAIRDYFLDFRYVKELNF